MITKTNIDRFSPIVSDAIDELFNHCINKECRDNEFLIFLENGHYDEAVTINSSGKNSPYIIGQGFDGIKDLDRMAFVETFVQMPFEELINKTTHPQEKFDIRRQSTALSMMVYTHFWESKVFLRRLRLLAILAEGKEYDWKLVVRPKETYTYIKKNIRQVFQNQNLKIYDIIKKTYKSQIRNAFAHSDYYLSDGKVCLDNYDSKNKWSIESVTFAEFDEIIILTLLIHDSLTKKIEEYIAKLGAENPDRNIYIPENGGVSRTLHYRQTGSNSRWLWANQL